MRKLIRSTLLPTLALLALLLAACTGHDGSSGTLPGDSPEVGAVTTIRTKVALSYSAARTPAGGMVEEFAASEAEYRSASVKLTLPDGRVLVMSYDGAGEYSARVENLPSGSAGFIEAELGGVVVKNFFDRLASSDGTMDAGLTNPDSTLASDVLATFAQALSPVDGGYTVAMLLSGVQNATIDIDVTALRSVIEDGNVEGYELARQAYSGALTWDNVDQTTGAVQNLITSNQSVVELNELIAAGGILPPMRTDLAQEAKLVVAGYFDSYYNTRALSGLSLYLSDTGFLHSGDDKSEFMLKTEDEWNNKPLFNNLTSATLSGIAYAATPVEDFEGLGRTMFVVTFSGTYDLTYSDGRRVTRAIEGGDKGLYVGKSNGEWMIFGNRMRMWFDYSVGYFSTNDPGTFTELSFELGNDGGYTPLTVTAGNGLIFDANDPVIVPPGAGLTPRYFFTLTGKQDVNWEYADRFSVLPTDLPYLDIDSKVLTVTATYTDSTVEEYTRVIRIKEPTTVITGFTQNENGSLTVSWRPPLLDEALLRTEVRVAEFGITIELPAGDRTVTIPASTLTTAGMEAGDFTALDVTCLTASSELSARQYFQWNGITVLPRAAAPTFSPTPGPYVDAQSVTLSTSTSGGAIYYTVNGTPPNQLTGTLYTAPFDVTQTTNVRAVTTKAGMMNSDVAEALYTITSETAPSISTSTLQNGLVGTAYGPQTVAASGGRDPYRWTVSAGTLPTGLSLNISTGALSGTPTASGTFNFTVRCTGANLLYDTQAFSIVVTGPPDIKTVMLSEGLVGLSYNHPLMAMGGITPYTWSISGGTPPNGITITSGGTLTGTPTAVGTFNFTVRCTGDNGLYDDQGFAITVTGPPEITTATLSGGVVGTPYSRTLSATGGVPSYIWALESGSLPTGLSLSSGGAITGTPSASGTANFSVRCTGDNGLYDIQALSIAITLAPVAPTITTTSLPSGSTTAAYSQALSATGGAAPYTWTVASGSLPSGLTLAGDTISGTPTAGGTANFTARCTGNDGLYSEQALSILVTMPTVANPTFSPVSGTVFSSTVDVTVSHTGAALWYRVNGGSYTSTADPSVTLTLSATSTIDAYSTRPAYTQSSTVSATYTKDASFLGMELASVATSGAQAAGNSEWATISADGRYVLFTSQATNLTDANTNSVAQLYLRDRATGQTSRVSVDASGTPSNGANYVSAITPDGQFVAFHSEATNLFPADTYIDSDIFVKNRVNGSITNASIRTDGDQSLGHAWFPRISDDGRYVAFMTQAQDLSISDSDSAWDIYYRDMSLGTTTLISAGVTGGEADGAAAQPVSMSADGGYLTFIDDSSNLIASGDTNGGRDVFLWERASGKVSRVSLTATGAQSTTGASNDPNWAEISADASYIAFDTTADDIVTGDTNALADIFLRNRVTGVTTRVSVSSTGAQSNGNSRHPTLSADGRYVAFTSNATNLVPGMTSNTYFQIYRRDNTTGDIVLMSRNPAGDPANASCFNPMISADGRNVTFYSQATNLAASDTNGAQDVFVAGPSYSVAPPVITTTSVPDGTVSEPYDQKLTAINGAGPYVWTNDRGRMPTGLALMADGYFTGTPTNAGVYNFTLRATDTNGLYDTQDITFTIVDPRLTTRISLDSAGNESSSMGNNQGVMASADGRFVLFNSNDPFADSGAGVWGGCYLRDNLTGKTTYVAVDSNGNPGDDGGQCGAITPDGRYATFYTRKSLVAEDTGVLSDVYRHDFITGETVLVSADSTGVPGNGESFVSAISSDGRYVVFESYATNLVAGDSNGTIDIFRRDIQAGTTIRVSLSNTGGEAHGFTYDPVISADGNLIAFYSGATDLVTGDTNGFADVFVRNVSAGTTTRTSVTSAGAQAAGESYSPMLTPDGKYVIFSSTADNLVADDTNSQEDVFLRDLTTGTVERLSISSNATGGIAGNGESWGLGISSDARYVVFSSLADNLVENDTNLSWDIFLRDRTTGVTTRQSVSSSGEEGDGDSDFGGISSDGTQIFFESGATNLVSNDLNSTLDVFLRGPALGVGAVSPPVFSVLPRHFTAAQSVALSTATSGATIYYTLNDTAPTTSSTPYGGTPISLSTSAAHTIRAIAVKSGLSDSPETKGVFTITIAAPPTITLGTLPEGTQGTSYNQAVTVSGGSGSFTWTLETGTLPPGLTLNPSTGELTGTPTTPGSYTFTLRCTDSSSGLFATRSITVVINAPMFTERVSVTSSGTEVLAGGENNAISGNGRFVAFTSAATDLVANDTNGKVDCFVRDRLTGVTERVSVFAGGGQSSDACAKPSISADGRYVVFYFNPTSGTQQVWVRDRQMGMTTQAGLSSTGVLAAGHTFDPSISADGRYVTFSSQAANLVTGDTNGNYDIFRRDLLTGTTIRVSLSSTGAQLNFNSGASKISADGNRILFASNASNVVPGNTAGNWNLYVRDVNAGTTVQADLTSTGLRPNNYASEYAFSGDGNYVAFASEATNLVAGDTNGLADIFLRNISAATTTLVSASATGVQSDSISLSPAISSDGRYVAFLSSASNLVAGDTTVYADAYVRDNTTGSVRLVSVNSAGAQANSQYIYVPTISADGQQVAFDSWASNLVPNDTNGTSDVFARGPALAANAAVPVVFSLPPMAYTSAQSVALTSATSGAAIYYTLNDTAPTTSSYLYSGAIALDRSGTVTIRAIAVKSGLSNSAESVATYTMNIPLYTERVSLTSAGAQSAGGISNVPNISSDGRFVVFTSTATDLVPSDTNGMRDCFVRDRLAGTTERVSIASDGTEASTLCIDPVISGDGRYVAFHSFATNLVSGDSNSASDIFLHDRQTGVTTLVSRSTAGALGNANSSDPAISADGRYVAFTSYATNFDASDTNGAEDVFRHDNVTGATIRVSLSSTGAQLDSTSVDGKISADGNRVLFASWASNVVPGDTDGNNEIFVRDIGAATTIKASLGSAGEQATANCEYPALSGDGNVVAFQTTSSGLVAGDTNGVPDVFARNIAAGTLTRVSVSAAGAQGDAQSTNPALSFDGRTVAFHSYATNLVTGDVNTYPDVFVRDNLTGSIALADVSSAGTQTNDSNTGWPAISSDGKYVSFYSNAANLVTGDTNGSGDVFVRGPQFGAATTAPVAFSLQPMIYNPPKSLTLSSATSGATIYYTLNDTQPTTSSTQYTGTPIVLNTLGTVTVRAIAVKSGLADAPETKGVFTLAAITERVNVTSAGAEATGVILTPSRTSDDGRFVAFTSLSATLAAGDTNNSYDIFVRDRLTGQTTRVSVASDGTQAAGDSTNPTISGDGRYVAFQSSAANLVSGDTNGMNDAFVHDRQTGTTTRVSLTNAGAEVSSGGYGPMISRFGTHVAFISDSNAFGYTDTNGTADIFVRNLATNTTTCASLRSDGTATGNGASTEPVISGTGAYVAFTSSASNIVASDSNGASDIFRRDMIAGTTARASVSSAGTQSTGGSSLTPSISEDGQFVVFHSTATNLVASDTNATQDVFLRKFTDSTTTRVSVGPSDAQATGASTNGVISGNGGYVAFTSSASNLVSGDTNGNTDIFVRDLSAGKTEIASVSSGLALGDGPSAYPGISYNGSQVVFQSGSTNLVPNDTNGANDFFAHGTPLGVGAAVPVVFSIPPRLYATGQSVALTTSTSGASIYYTLNDTAPTTSSTQYTGTPISLPGGLYTIRAIAVKSGLTDSPETKGVFTVNLPLSITTSSPLVSGDKDDPYSVTLAATGGIQPYTWSVATGTLPTGVTLSTAGVLSGTPSIDGNFSLTARVTDNLGTQQTKSFTFTIYGSPTISTTSIPNGTVGVAYSTTIAATGGRTPYVWSFYDGVSPQVSSYPPGLAIDPSTGVLSGTPTTGGNYAFWVKCEGANLWANAVWFTMTVANPTAAAPKISPYDGMSYGGSWGLTMTVTSDIPGATLYVTTDGTTPSTSHWHYTGASPIEFSGGGQDWTIKAMVAKSGMTDSAVTTANYTYIPDVGPSGANFASANSDGTQGNGGSYNAKISADGHYVVFTSNATGLVGTTASGRSHVYRKNRLTQAVELVSLNTSATQGNSNSYSPAVSADGRYVAFISDATDLITGDTNGVSDVFVRDMTSGVTTRVSASTAGAAANGSSLNPAISGDGRFVAFESSASNLITGDTNGEYDVFLRDRNLNTTIRVSVSAAGTQGTLGSHEPSLSHDGRYVAFASEATTLVPEGDTNGASDVFVRDNSNGTVTMVSVDAGGAQGDNSSFEPSISGNGQYVAFTSYSTNFAGGGMTSKARIFVSGLSYPNARLVSKTMSGSASNSDSEHPEISADGSTVVFSSNANDLVSSSTNSLYNVYARDLWWNEGTGFTYLVSMGRFGNFANSNSHSPSVSSDGRYVAYETDASNIALSYVPGMGDYIPSDSNGASDIVAADTAITFADANIEAEVRTQTGVATGPLMPVMTINLNSLTVNTKGVYDLNGIQYLSRLTSLNLSDNDFYDLASIGALGNLEHLYLSKNLISDLAPLSRLTKLISLNAAENNISEAHLSSIVSIASLTTVNMDMNVITDSTAFASMTNLTELRLASNKLTTVTPLNGHAFDLLDVSGNCIPNTTGITATTLFAEQANTCAINFPDLRLDEEIHLLLGVSFGTPLTYADLQTITGTVNFSYAGITDISGVEWLDNVTSIEFTGNPGLINTSALGGMDSLTQLKMNGTGLTSLTPLLHATNLTVLEVFDNAITDVSPISSLPLLQTFYFSNNAVSSGAPLIAHPALTSVDISCNAFGTGEVSALEAHFGEGLINGGQFCVF